MVPMVKISEDDVLAIFKKHYGGDFKEVSFLTGDVNKTYLLKNETGEKVIFQRLAGIFNEDLIADFNKISRHLRKDGWEVPRSLHDKKDNTFIRDEAGEIWRAISFIESEGRPTYVDPDAIGSILAKLHTSLAKLDYEPKFSLPHFHDTEHYLGKLKAMLEEFEDDDRIVADRVLEEYDSLPELPKVKEQLIHADARMANILFKDNKPFTFIDFDTVMTSTIWVEIGDLVRSIIERDVQDKKRTEIDELHHLGSAYLKESGLKMTDDEFFGHMLTSARVIALELAMRFMIDIIEDFYFVWENTEYGSRHEHSIARVKQQLEVNRRLKNAQHKD